MTAAPMKLRSMKSNGWGFKETQWFIAAGKRSLTKGGSSMSRSKGASSRESGNHRLESLVVLQRNAAEAVDHGGLGRAELDPFRAIELHGFVKLF